MTMTRIASGFLIGMMAITVAAVLLMMAYIMGDYNRQSTLNHAIDAAVASSTVNVISGSGVNTLNAQSAGVQSIVAGNVAIAGVNGQSFPTVQNPAFGQPTQPAEAKPGLIERALSTVTSILVWVLIAFVGVFILRKLNIIPSADTTIKT